MAHCCLVESFGWATLAVLGATFLYQAVRFVYSTLLGPLLGRNIKLSECGPWAVVTGATDGIGKSYAKLLARAGLNVVLVSRTPAKLKNVADEIKDECRSIEVRTIAVDFTEGQSIYPKLKTELDRINVGILINNVGMLVGFGTPYVEFPDDKGIHDLINCNIMSMARMCHIVLPQMVKRRRGVIVNIGSLSSALPTPLISLYGASKAFVEKFSTDLAAEVKGSGVTIQTVHPGYVHTNMAPLDRPSVAAPEPDVFAAAALKTLGLEGRTAGYWAHKIGLVFVDAINYFIPRRLMIDHLMNNIKEVGEEMKRGELKKKAKSK